MTLHIARSGQAGPPLVLIHGWAFSSAVWDPILAELGGRFSLYLLDLPGHGHSRDPAPGETLAACAREVLAQVPTQAYWIGWSVGGLVALSAAIQRSSGVRGLALVASSPRFVTSPDWPHGIPDAVLAAFAADLTRDQPGTLSRFVALQTRGAVASGHTARTLAGALRAAPLPRPGGLERGLQWLRETDLRADLARVACPVRLLLGERDTLVPAACAANILKLRPDWSTTVVAAGGHAPFLSDPGGFARWVAEGVGLA